MPARISRPLSILSFAAALALGTIAVSAETPMSHGAGSGQAPSEGGMPMGMMGKGEHAGMMGGEMKQMMSKMHEMMDMMASHVDDRLASLKTELKITDAQMPQWNSFADALRSSAKSMETMHHEMMQSHAGRSKAVWGGDKSYPDMGAIKKTAAGPAQESASESASESVGTGLPAKLAMHEKMAAEHLSHLQAIKAALDPLYASFSDEQKKVVDGLMVGPMGVM